MISRKVTEDYVLARDAVDDLEEQLKEAKLHRDAKEAVLLSAMENAGVESFKDEEFGTLYQSDEYFASIRDQDTLYDYLRSNDLSGIIKETVHPKTLSGVIKEKMDQMREAGELEIDENGKPLCPFPGATAFVKTRVRLRRKAK